LLAAGCPTLLVPRVIPRTEQSVRAERLERSGVVDVVSAAEITPEHIGTWLSTAVHAPSVTHAAIDLNGLDRIAAMAGKLAALSPRPARKVPAYA